MIGRGRKRLPTGLARKPRRPSTSMACERRTRRQSGFPHLDAIPIAAGRACRLFFRLDCLRVVARFAARGRFPGDAHGALSIGRHNRLRESDPNVTMFRVAEFRIGTAARKSARVRVRVRHLRADASKTPIDITRNGACATPPRLGPCGARSLPYPYAHLAMRVRKTSERGCWRRVPSKTFRTRPIPEPSAMRKPIQFILQFSIAR